MSLSGERGTLSVTPIVTNVQDFLVHLKNNLGDLSPSIPAGNGCRNAYGAGGDRS